MPTGTTPSSPGLKTNPAARRVVYALATLMLLFMAGIVLSGAFGKKMFLSAINPDTPFETVPQPPEPDYADLESWAALPFSDDFADMTPEDLAAPIPSTRPADVFFVHSTTFLASGAWNAAIDDPLAAPRAEEGSIKHQASVFQLCCRIFAPRYRQATFFATLSEGGEDSRKAIDLAYRDVARAFEHFLRRWHGDRPLIVAGHGQGSRHALRLLEDYVMGSRYETQLVAAYLPGLGITADYLEDVLPRLSVCAGPEETACVVSWTTLLESAPEDPYATQSLRYPDGVYKANANRARICVNPLNWFDDGTPATPSQNPGAVPFTDGLAPLPATQSGITGAVCDPGGALRIAQPAVKGFDKALIAPGDYHRADYNLFYVSIRRNALERVEAFRR